MGRHEVPSNRARRDRARAARIGAILSAAERLFCERGFDRVSMDELAEAAELAKGGVYHYFTSKAEILYNLLRSGLDRLFAALTVAVEGQKKPLDKLRALIFAHSKFLAENRNLMRLIWSFLNDPTPALKDKQRRSLRAYHSCSVDLIKQVLREAAESGELRELDPDSLAIVIGGILMSSVGSAGSGHDCDWQARSGLIWEVLTNGIRKRVL